jgi:hypothetical protein
LRRAYASIASLRRPTISLPRNGFLDEIERAALDGVDRHGDVALPRNHEDRRRIILAVQLLQDIET